jgi:hypothetical protein
MVSAEQQQVLNFLQTCPNSSFSPMEVGRKAGTRKQFEEDPRWAIECLRYLLDMKLIERDAQGRYKMATPKESLKD